MSTVKKPVLLDETGQKILEQMRTQNTLLSAIARKSIKTFTGWREVRDIVKRGLAPEIFSIGDQFVVPWTDYNYYLGFYSSPSTKKYSLNFDVVRFENVTLEDGSEVPAMLLQCHDAIFRDSLATYDLCFDAPENEIAEGVFSTDYSYYVANESGSVDKYRYLEPGVDYTIGSSIPASPTYYRTAIKDKTGRVCQYGYNRWAHSCIRQFLNGSEADGKWWTPQHLGDVAPEYVTRSGSKISGFMRGFVEDDAKEFLSCLRSIKVTTALNDNDKKTLGTSEDTFDTFFLPSLEQMYAAPQVAGVEGHYFEYWKEATGAIEPNRWYTEGINPGYVVPNNTRNLAIRLRSVRMDTQFNTWSIYANGEVTRDTAAAREGCYTPVCAIC